ncbi:MAG: CotH kinase family protein [Bacteroidaceae bacterium]|nr:CotH kinase family protein [Bacteroidaceae bacterium]
MYRRASVLALILMVAVVAMGDVVTGFNATTKYRIESLFFLGSSAAIGDNHSVNSPLCMTMDNAASYPDCWWYFVEQGSGTGQYALKNASTGEYITLDDQYTNTPQILRYAHMSSYIDGEKSLWYICNTTSSEDDSEIFYFQSVYNTSFFFNVRTGSYALGAYSKSGIPYGSNETFNLYDSQGRQFHTGGSGPDPVDPTPLDSTQVEPIEGKVLFVYRADGRVEAVPEQYIEKIEGAENHNGQWSIVSDQLKINFKPQTSGLKSQISNFTFHDYEVDSLSYTAHELPAFSSFKFNNKFNPHIIDDAIGVFDEDTLITVSVVGIGKTLRPSFKLDDNVQAWIGDSLQHSKITRVRFDKDVVYTVARPGETILRRTYKGVYTIRPYGRDVRVSVDFATDHSTAAYQVPTIYVTTDDGTPITSKSYYWNGKITIDGGGVFPDLPETPMQIKGRGNTSWTSSGKAPYHFKFDTATKVLGLKKGKHWNLIANAQTRSMTSNAVAMKMAQLVETAGANHEIPVELYINGEYRGSYNLTEKVGLSNNSIDLDDESYAVMLELDSYYDEVYKFRDKTYNLPVNIKAPDFSEGTTPLTQTMIQDRFNLATEALKRKDEYLDVYYDLDYLARYLFVTDYTANVEIMHPKSTFLYNANLMDTSSPFVYGPVWDFDWAFGYSENRDYFTAQSTLNFWARTGDTVGFAWSKDLRYCDERVDKIYYNLWHDFIYNGSLDELLDYCDDYYNFAAPSFTHDNTRWRHGDAKTYATVTTSSKNWLRKRAEYIYNFLSNTLGYADKDYLTPNGSMPLMGDVNDDGSITTSDVVCVLNYILNLPNEEFEFDRADTDKNGIITVSDIINVRNLIGSGGGSGGGGGGGGGIVYSRRYYGLPEATAVINTGPVRYTAEGVSIPLTITVEEGSYSGIQFDLSIPDGMTIDNLDISRAIPDFDVEIQELANNAQSSILNAQCYRVSLYSSAQHKLPVGRSELTLELGKNNAQCSMLNAQSYKVSLSNILYSTSLGEDERSGSRTATFVINPDDPTAISSERMVNGQSSMVNGAYDLQGRKLNAQLPKGIYIQNGKKLLMK